MQRLHKSINWSTTSHNAQQLECTVGFQWIHALRWMHRLYKIVSLISPFPQCTMSWIHLMWTSPTPKWDHVKFQHLPNFISCYNIHSHPMLHLLLKLWIPYTNITCIKYYFFCMDINDMVLVLFQVVAGTLKIT